MKNDLEVTKTKPQEIETKDLRMQIETLKDQIAKDCTDSELQLFTMVCKKTALDPFTKQIYAIKRDGKMTIQASIDGLRLVADRSGLYAGQVGPFWCGEDGVWRDVWLSKETPSAAKVGVFKKGFAEPLWGVARFDAYAQTTRDFKTGNVRLNSMWFKMPDVMIAKVAEALALRKAFPNDLSGIYASEEMDQASNDTPNNEKRGAIQNQPAKTIVSVPQNKNAPDTDFAIDKQTKTVNLKNSVSSVMDVSLVSDPNREEGFRIKDNGNKKVIIEHDSDPVTEHMSGIITGEFNHEDDVPNFEQETNQRVLSEQRIGEITSYTFKTGVSIGKYISEIDEAKLRSLHDYVGKQNKTQNSIAYQSLLADAYYYFYGKEL